jgi:hypothetical protein
VRAQPAARCEGARGAGDRGLELAARAHAREVELREPEGPEGEVQVAVDDAGQRDRAGRERDDRHARARGGVDGGDRAVLDVDARRARVRRICGPERALEPDACRKRFVGCGHRGTYPRNR